MYEDKLDKLDILVLLYSYHVDSRICWVLSMYCNIRASIPRITYSMRAPRLRN